MSIKNPQPASPTGSRGRTGALILGGGLIGGHAAIEFLRHGYRVTVLSLPGRSARLPFGARLVEADANRLTDPEMRELLAGHRAVVFAAGVDDRVLPRAPALEFFRAGNVGPAERFFRLARTAGASRGVLVGSYFAHFAGAWPELQLAERHPYVRSRLEQERAALAAAAPDLRLVVLRLPYVFGALPGVRPLWAPLVRYVRAAPVVFYTRGGSNIVAATDVAAAIRAAVERDALESCYEVGGRNVTWRELLGDLSALAGRRKRVVALPGWTVRTATRLLALWHRLRGRESGLDPVAFVEVQTRRAFLDPARARSDLGCGTAGLPSALAETVRSSLAPRCLD